MSPEHFAPPGDWSTRARATEPFLAMEILERAAALEREGHRIAHLELGEPAASPPEAAVQACAEALAAGETGYTDSRGTWALREDIAADYETRFGQSVDPARVLVTQGTSAAMTLVFGLLIEPGDEVLIPTPHYPCYPNFVRFFGGVPIFVPTEASSGWHLDPDRVAAAITKRTRAIIVGSPANPTGSVQPAAVMERLAELGPTLVSDEIYDGLVYGGAQTTSASRFGDRAFVLDGFSKRYAMTGFRLGWVVAPESAMRRLQVLQQNLFISASSFVQVAGRAALAQGSDMTAALRSDCESRRDELLKGLLHLGFRVEREPEGAFYILADATRFGRDSRGLAQALLERAYVGVTPGIDFGEAAEGRLRFCYAVGRETIVTALEALAPVLREIEAEGGIS